jgi:hypothetical protein
MIALGAVRRHHDGQQLRDRLAVRRIELDAELGSNEQRQRARDAADPGVRDRKSFAEARRSRLFAPAQRAKDRRLLEAVNAGYRCRHDFKRLGSIACVDAEQDVLWLQP